MEGFGSKVCWRHQPKCWKMLVKWLHFLWPTCKIVWKNKWFWLSSLTHKKYGQCFIKTKKNSKKTSWWRLNKDIKDCLFKVLVVVKRQQTKMHCLFTSRFMSLPIFTVTKSMSTFTVNFEPTWRATQFNSLRLFWFVARELFKALDRDWIQQ